MVGRAHGAPLHSVTLSKTEACDLTKSYASCPFKNRLYTETFDDCMTVFWWPKAGVHAIGSNALY